MLIRPVSGWIGLPSYPAERSKKLTLSLFGIRGVGTIYHVAYGSNHMSVPDAELLWGIVVLTVTPICARLTGNSGATRMRTTHHRPA